MGWEPRVLLGTLGVFFVLRATVTLALQGMAGFYTPTVLTCAMYGAPGVILGTCIAFPVVKHISQQAFRKVLLCVIAVAGVVCLVRALGYKAGLPPRLLTTGESLPAFCLAVRAARYIPCNLRQRPAGKRTGCVPVCREGGFYSTGSSGKKDVIR